MEITICYEVAKAVTDQELVRTGERNSQQRRVEVALKNLDSELQRAALVVASRYQEKSDTVTLCHYTGVSSYYGSSRLGFSPLEYDHVLSEAEAIDEVCRMLQRVLEFQPQLEALRAEEAANEAEVQGYLQQLLEIEDDQEFMEAYCVTVPMGYFHPELEGVLRDMRDREARYQVVCAQERENVRKREDALRWDRQQEQIAGWVIQHGTRNQKQRLEAGLFPPEEYLNAIAAEVFPDRPRYEPLQHRDLPCGGCYEDVDFYSEKADSATPEEWEDLEFYRSFRRHVSHVELRRHFGKCRCGETATRTGILVEVTVGEFTLRREFAA